MLYIRYEIVENGNLNLADNVEKYGDLTKKDWKILPRLKHVPVHKRFAIGCCDDTTALLFRCPDETLRLVENIEKCFEPSGTYWWRVRVKCQDLSDSFPVSHAADDKEYAICAYLETLACNLEKENLLVKE